MSKDKVSIVIPVWNGLKLLKKNFKSVYVAAGNPRNNITEIVVVDDYSGDDSVNYLRKNYKKNLRLIKHTKNRGFSVSVNRGVRMAKGNLVCLLNQDVAPSENFLEYVFGHFDNEGVFAVGLHEKGYGPAAASFRNGFFEHRNMGEMDAACESMWASGGSAVFRRDLWRELGGLDQELFSPFYWEDVDLGYRAYKRGYIIYWEPKAKVLHQHEAVINEANFNRKSISVVKERNELLFIWKNISSRNLIRKHFVYLVKRLLRHPGYAVVVWSALKRIRLVLRKRKKEKSESKVSDEAIFSRFS